jgi:hypothetical protein
MAISTDTVFDPEVLSAAFGRVEFKSKADTTAEQVIRPIGLLVLRDLARPPPHPALLFELGNDVYYPLENKRHDFETCCEG